MNRATSCSVSDVVPLMIRLSTANPLNPIEPMEPIEPTEPTEPTEPSEPRTKKKGPAGCPRRAACLELCDAPYEPPAFLGVLVCFDAPRAGLLALALPPSSPLAFLPPPRRRCAAALRRSPTLFCGFC